jgi:hypothetical protein
VYSTNRGITKFKQNLFDETNTEAKKRGKNVNKMYLKQDHNL